MTISYNWLSQYLPQTIEPERLSRILTSIGLEVEKMEPFEEVKGGLQGLVIGEVLSAAQHPNADKLKLTNVSVGDAGPLQIVCGAPNVAAGQKVVVATVGTTIYPTGGDPLTMKLARIRGIESMGMICAEDEIGLGTSHAGIMVLPEDVKAGTPAAAYFQPFSDIIYEIGLTPNRMDAMSHWGVARDVCAYLSHHDKRDSKPVLPATQYKKDNDSLKIEVVVEDKAACPRYSGVTIAGVRISASPKWLQERLKAIGLRPINNIVDITNFIQHETGQPLHAFDYDKIRGKKVVVKKEAEGTTFTTLDGKERKLSAADLMINDAEGPMCIAGVFGGAESGVSGATTNLFLESAYFEPVTIRKTSFRHGLRTDAATRFEKGIDISGTVNVLKRAAMLIKSLAGGEIASDIIDLYPAPQPKKEVMLRNHYLKKLSGKNYHADAVKNILGSLGFTIAREGMDSITFEVPYHKPDVSLPADIVEEILRIDGLDNIEIPHNINLSPAVENLHKTEAGREKISSLLTGLGFTEILTNSITNSAYLSEEQLSTTVKLLNNLSSELNVLRPFMLHTALEVLRFNSNRKNNDLRLFEFGKTYAISGETQYTETTHLCLYLTGNLAGTGWKGKAHPADIYYLKGIAAAVLTSLGITIPILPTEEGKLTAEIRGTKLVELSQVDGAVAGRFDIKAPVFFADFYWDQLLQFGGRKVQVKELPKYPAVERDLALVLPKAAAFKDVETAISGLRLNKLKGIKLFDIFESEKLGADKKSLAVNFTFLDEEKTLTDKEIDGWMSKIMASLEKDLNAEIRK